MGFKQKKENPSLFDRICSIIDNYCGKSNDLDDQTIVQAYWNVGKEIITEEINQKIEKRSVNINYEDLSKRLTNKYFYGVTPHNLKIAYRFYLGYPRENQLNSGLLWLHYRLLLKIRDPIKRAFYEKECIQNSWSVRKLCENINSYIFERIFIQRITLGKYQ